MTDEEIHEYIHESIHIQIDLNEQYLQQFDINNFAQWRYDVDQETLIFSNEGKPGVMATIQVAGTFSKKSDTWLWGWANQSFPENVVKSLSVVRAFGEEHGIWKLTKDKWPGTEEDGWEMAAVASRLTHGKGLYRCPSNTGFLFLILTDIQRLQ